jgi:hypothetical protein
MTACSACPMEGLSRSKMWKTAGLRLLLSDVLHGLVSAIPSNVAVLSPDHRLRNPLLVSRRVGDTPLLS